MGHSQPSWSAPALESLEQRMLLAANANWTFLVYIDGDSANMDALALVNVNQMESVGSTGSIAHPGVAGGVNIAVQLDTLSGSTLRGPITKDGLPDTITSPLVDIGEQNMADPTILTDFIQWGMTTYPADHYALVILGNGAGIDGVIQDQTSNAFMSIKNLSTALANAEQPSGADPNGTKLDLIAFDADIMNTFEVDYQLKDFASVIVSSQAQEMNAGLPYNTILGDLTATPSMTGIDLSNSIVDRYGQAYPGAGANATMSSVDTSELDTMAGTMDQLASAYLLKDTDWSIIRDALDPTIGAVSTFDGTDGITDYADLKGLLAYINANATDPDIVAASNTALTAFNHLVLDNYASAGLDANGVSVYLPTLPAETVLDPVYTPDNFDFLQQPTGHVASPGATHWLSLLDAYEFPRPDLYVSSVSSGFQIVNGDPDVVDFGSTLSSDPMWIETFTIQNNGDADLTLSEPTVPDGFVLGHMDDEGNFVAGFLHADDGFLHVGPGLSVDITIGLSTDIPGSYGGPVTLANNDLNDGTFTYDGRVLSIGPGAFTFTVSGEVTSSGVIAVSGPTDDPITAGDPLAYHFGTFDLGGFSPVVTFTVTNTDVNDLDIGTITIPKGYIVIDPVDNVTPLPDGRTTFTLPVTTLGFNESETFTLQLDTSKVGHYAGNVVIANSDPTHSQFSFGIDGLVSGPNLVIDDATYTAGYYASGETLDLNLTVANLGDLAIAPGTSVQVAVHLSTDAIWGNADDLTVYLHNISLPAIAAGDEATISQSLHLNLGGVSPGNYYVATQINGDDTTFSATADVTVYDSRLYTRLINGKHASFKDDSGDKVTINFSGAGHVDILTSNSMTGRSMAGDVREMLLAGTAGNSVLRVTAAGNGMTVGQITARGEVKSILTRRVNLAPDLEANLDGSLSVNGGCGRITLGNLASGSSIIIGLSDDISTTTITLGRVADSTVESLTPIKSFSALDWLNQDASGTDNVADELSAPSIGKLSTTRDGRTDKTLRQYDTAMFHGRTVEAARLLDSLKAFSAGDFQADLNLTAAPDGQPALGSTKIAGDLSDALWRIDGGISDLTVAHLAGGSTIRTTGSIAKITIGQANAFDVLAGVSAAVARHATLAADFTNPDASIGSYTIKGKPSPVVTDLYFQDSNISAPSIAAVSLLNAKWDNALTPFGLWGEQITSVKYASKPYGVKWIYPWSAGSFVELQDMKIQLL